ncbi:peroxynitrite isomerase THAP4-like [Sciurus carolinensis]|uniref:peroxynitrite isomerase THAP4-like n=1 Tax=Sciurus carolinensis TaxID=30640 RepID=UPI001FB4F3CC|nr:peroxynitrite isomerase THAP4-like [Sciurus carolinensis]
MASVSLAFLTKFFVSKASPSDTGTGKSPGPQEAALTSGPRKSSKVHSRRLLTAVLLSSEPPKMNPVVEPLSWMLGTWLSVPLGAGTYLTPQPFQYLEEVRISHMDHSMLNFSFQLLPPGTRKPLHRECGFICLKPDTNKVAFISTQNTGVVEVEEGEVNGLSRNLEHPSRRWQIPSPQTESEGAVDEDIISLQEAV